MWWDEEPASPGAPAWALTFGDTMSLLLTFFIVLVSFADLEQNAKFQAMALGMKSQFHRASVDWSWLPAGFHPPDPTITSWISTRRIVRNQLLGPRTDTDENDQDRLIR